MKTFPGIDSHRLWIKSGILISFLTVSPLLFAQSDDFNSGTDAGWLKITNANYPATYSFPPDDMGGFSYRLQGTGASSSQSRVYAYQPTSYTDFYVAADIVAWSPSVSKGQVFGVFGRGQNIPGGAPTAVLMNTRINNNGVDGTTGTRGQVSIYLIVTGNPSVPVAVANSVTLVPGRKYRFTLSAVGQLYQGNIYDLNDLTRPLVTLAGDNTYAGGFYVPFFPTNGVSGVVNQSLNGSDPTTDSTFDNFVATVSPPISVAAPGTPHGLAGAPQVVNRSPVSFSNFYPASGGITFDATTLTTTNSINTNATRLFLNGFDVSSRLVMSGPDTNVSVAFHGLASNAVYEARIELQDALGRRTTNEFTFDTFVDAYLDSPPRKTIDVEDYDFSSGQFIDDPPISGYVSNLFANPVNVDSGYVDRPGEYGVDYWDYRDNTGITEKEFRSGDQVETQQGNEDIAFASNSANPFTTIRNYWRPRQKYAATNLQEYIVRRTEVTEWLNYTRIFNSNFHYNVYMQMGAATAQPVQLDQIVDGSTANLLGNFNAPGTVALWNYRYVPLTDVSGKMAVLNLSGTNTLRLMMTNPMVERAKHSLALNYFVFVPAVLVDSAPDVAGPYVIDSSATVDSGLRSIIIPQGGTSMYYRLRHDIVETISSISVSDGNVVLTY